MKQSQARLHPGGLNSWQQHAPKELPPTVPVELRCCLNIRENIFEKTRQSRSAAEG